MYCPHCGKQTEASNFCSVCGQAMSGLNTSGQGDMSQIPDEVRGWNWGAFGLSWIWGLGNGTYIALLTLIPFVNLVMIFVLGAKGSEWAWKNKHWDSIEEFQDVQRTWRNVWIILLSVFVVFWFISALLNAGGNN